MFALDRVSWLLLGVSVGLVLGGCSSPADDEILAMGPTDDGPVNAVEHVSSGMQEEAEATSSAALHADDIAAMEPAADAAKEPATPEQSTVATYSTTNAFGVACRGMEDCTRFCKAACDVLPSGGAHCTRVPTGDGLLPADSPLLRRLPTMKHVSAGSGARATEATVAGLERLDAWLEASPERKEYGYTVRVNNCWRDGINDIKKECYFILKGKDPNELGLAWPGASAHSGGKGCDIVLVDAKGKAATSCSAAAESSLDADIDFRTASRLLDEALTNDTVGARRLNYEAWHYEWDGPTSCRCKAPACADDHWPPMCSWEGGKGCRKK